MLRYIEGRYHVTRWIEMRGKSASKGRQQQDLNRAVELVQASVATVVLAWSVDRIERRGAAYLYEFMKGVTDAGGRVEFTSQPQLNMTGPAREILLSVLGVLANLEAEIKSQRVMGGHAVGDSNASFRGKPPFGFTTTGDRYHKQLVHDPVKGPLAKGIFERLAGGESTAAVSRWLSQQGVAKTPEAVWRLVKRVRCYSTGIYQIERDGQVVAEHFCEPLISAGLHKAAEQAMSSRMTGFHTRDLRGSDFSGLIRCQHGKPMYRHIGGANQTIRYYRAKGCGCFRNANDADYLVGAYFGGDWTPELRRVRLEDERANRLAEIDAELKRLPLLGLSRHDHTSELDRLWAAQDDAEKLETGGGWKWEPTGRTLGAAWGELTTNADRLAYARASGYEIRLASADAAGAWERNGVRLVFESQDYEAGALTRLTGLRTGNLPVRNRHRYNSLWRWPLTNGNVFLSCSIEADFHEVPSEYLWCMEAVGFGDDEPWTREQMQEEGWLASPWPSLR
jgi:DNA invertase Pin-like site-specific DNA recombinase